VRLYVVKEPTPDIASKPLVRRFSRRTEGLLSLHTFVPENGMSSQVDGFAGMTAHALTWKAPRGASRSTVVIHVGSVPDQMLSVDGGDAEGPQQEQNRLGGKTFKLVYCCAAVGTAMPVSAAEMARHEHGDVAPLPPPPKGYDSFVAVGAAGQLWEDEEQERGRRSSSSSPTEQQRQRERWRHDWAREPAEEIAATSSSSSSSPPLPPPPPSSSGWSPCQQRRSPSVTYCLDRQQLLPIYVVSQNGYLIEPPCPPCTSHGASMR
jgi:hypothetical protein